MIEPLLLCPGNSTPSFVEKFRALYPSSSAASGSPKPVTAAKSSSEERKDMPEAKQTLLKIAQPPSAKGRKKSGSSPRRKAVVPYKLYPQNKDMSNVAKVPAVTKQALANQENTASLIGNSQQRFAIVIRSREDLGNKAGYLKDRMVLPPIAYTNVIRITLRFLAY